MQLSCGNHVLSFLRPLSHVNYPWLQECSFSSCFPPLEIQDYTNAKITAPAKCPHRWALKPFVFTGMPPIFKAWLSLRKKKISAWIQDTKVLSLTRSLCGRKDRVLCHGDCYLIDGEVPKGTIRRFLGHRKAKLRILMWNRNRQFSLFFNVFKRLWWLFS